MGFAGFRFLKKGTIFVQIIPVATCSTCSACVMHSTSRTLCCIFSCCKNDIFCDTFDSYLIRHHIRPYCKKTTLYFIKIKSEFNPWKLMPGDPFSTFPGPQICKCKSMNMLLLLRYFPGTYNERKSIPRFTKPKLWKENVATFHSLHDPKVPMWSQEVSLKKLINPWCLLRAGSRWRTSPSAWATPSSLCALLFWMVETRQINWRRSHHLGRFYIIMIIE